MADDGSASNRRDPSGHSAKRIFEDTIQEGQNRVPGTVPPQFDFSPALGKNEEDEEPAYLFWDFDTAPLPSGYTVQNLKAQITTALHHYRKNLSLKRMKQVCVGYGDLKQHFTAEQFVCLKAQGFIMHHVVKRRTDCRVCKEPVPPKEFGEFYGERDQARDLLLMSMYDAPKSAIILLISGDVDFASTVATLENRGHTMLVAVPENCHPMLLARGCRHWYYLQLFQGKKPIPVKQGGKNSGSNGESSKQQKTPKSAGAFLCKSCNKTFTSEMGLQSHTKDKHGAAA